MSAKRFVVREIVGVPIGAGYHTPMLSVSVLDSAYCYREVARFNEEEAMGAGRTRAGGYRTKPERREALRTRAIGLAAMLEADHA